LLLSATSKAKEITIGVNTSDNYERTSSTWQPTIDYLNKNLKNYKFKIMYLKYGDIGKNIKNKDVDFVILEPSLLVKMQKRYDLTAIGRVLRDRNGTSVDKKSAVIFTSSERKDIILLDEIQGKRLLVNSINSYATKIAFGEILAKELNPSRVFTKISELENKNDEDVIYKILDGKSDIGIIESGVIEKMVESKNFQKEHIRILNQQNHSNFPYFSSSKLYPEIVIAKLPHILNQDAKNLISTLFLIKADSKVAKSANISSWYIPDNYDSVEQLLEELEILNSKNYYYDMAIEILKERKIELIAGLILIIIIIVLVIRETFLIKRIDKMSSLDQLTGINNRIKINYIIKNEFQRSKRYGHPFSMILLDITPLREINRKYGQKIGDEFLIYIAEELQENIRVTDRLSRWDGEKFLIVCPNTKNNDSLALSNKIEAIIKEKDFFDDMEVNINSGISSFEEDDNSESDVIERLNRALDNKMKKR